MTLTTKPLFAICFFYFKYVSGLLPTSILSVGRIGGTSSSFALPFTDVESYDELNEVYNFDRFESASQILDNPPGSLTKEVVDIAFPLLWSWGKTETVEGASMVERLLGRLEEEIVAGNDDLSLNHKHYTLAVDAWGKSGHENSSYHAERLLRKMEQHAGDISPSRVTYNAVICAYAKQGNMDRAASILTEMENSLDIQPITNDYNALLTGYARLGKAREAEEVLKSMVDRCNLMGDTCQCVPDIYSYNILLDAWSKSNLPGRGNRAESILEALLLQSDNNEIPFRPDSRTYGAVMCAIVRSNEEDSVQRAQQLLEQAEATGVEQDQYLHTALLDAYASCSEPGSAEKAEELLDKLEAEGLANHVAYNTVLKAWKTSDEADAPKRAEAVLKRMEERNLADTISYSTTIATLAKEGSKAAAQRAEEILERMKNERAELNTQTLNTVMNAWIRCGEMQRAERILNKMEYAFREGTGDVSPSVVSYSTIINGWAKSRDPQAAKKAEDVFQRMTEMFELGNEDARPNLRSFVTLITAVTKSRQPDAAERAEKILFQMYDQFKQGNALVKPNTIVVTQVIDSWQKSGLRNAGERAETLLDWLIELYKTDHDESLCPNEFSFANAISAWAKSRKFGKATRAKSILKKMVEMHESGQIVAKPNIHCYTAVINSCAHCENDEFEKRDALRIAIETYKELIDSDYGDPNEVTFSTLVSVLRNVLPECQKRSSAVGTIFKKCAEDGHVDDVVVRRLQSTLNNEELRVLLGDAVSADGTVDITELPTEWRRNVKTAVQKRRNGKVNYSSHRP